MYKWWKRPCLWLTGLGILLGLASILLTPCFTVKAQGHIVAIRQAREHLPFSIHFIHSVQKTPVEENLEVEADGSFLLRSTRYQSFGVGLPFLAEEGNFREDFRQDGDYYVFDDMNRHFPELSLRTGVGTKLTLDVDGTVYPLYKCYEPGTRIDLFTAPLVAVLWR